MQLCDACAAVMEAAILHGDVGVILCDSCLASVHSGGDFDDGVTAPVEIGAERRTVDEMFETPAVLEIVAARPVTNGYWLTLNDGRALFLSLALLDPTAFAPH